MRTKPLFIAFDESVIPVLATEFDANEAKAMHLGSDRIVLLTNLHTLESRANPFIKMRAHINSYVHAYIFKHFDELPDYYHFHAGHMYI